MHLLRSIQLLAAGLFVIVLITTAGCPSSGENLGGAQIVLDAEDMQRIEDASKSVRIAGERYPDEFLKLSGR